MQKLFYLKNPFKGLVANVPCFIQSLVQKEASQLCFVHGLSALICSSLFTGTRLKSSRASTVNSSLVDTPIIWTAAKSQPIVGKPTSANPGPCCSKAD